MMAKEGSMLLSVLRFPSLHLLYLCDIYCVYLQNCGRCSCQFLVVQFDYGGFL